MEITEKLRKLIALRDHPNTSEQEVLNAAQAITKLLYKYNMEESDVSMEEKILNPILCEEIEYKTTLCGGKWYSSLVAVITNNNLCKCLIISIPNSKSGRLTRDKFQIVGRKNNIEMVKYMIDSYSNKFYHIGKYKYKNEYKGELTENKFLRSFLEGCAAGLQYKYQQLKKDYEGINALVVTTQNEIMEFLSNRNIRKGRQSKEKMDYSAYQSGYNTGKDAELNKGINQSNALLLK